MNSSEIIKAASKLPLRERANIAFLLAIQGQNDLAMKVKNTVPFKKTSQRDSCFTERIEAQYLLLDKYSGEYWRHKAIFFSSVVAISSFDPHEDNEKVSGLRTRRQESCQRLVALNLVPETIEQKHGIRCESITHYVKDHRVFESLNHPIEWLPEINDFHDEYIDFFERLITSSH